MTNLPPSSNGGKPTTDQLAADLAGTKQQIEQLIVGQARIEAAVAAIAHTQGNQQQSIELLHGLLTRIDEQLEKLIDQNSTIVDAYIAQQGGA